MMYITIRNELAEAAEATGVHGHYPKTKDFIWYVGSTMPEGLTRHAADFVIAVQADGDELEAVINGTSNIPYVANRAVQTWRGEMAQFIVDNLIPPRK